MLVLARRLNERIVLGGDIVITVLEVGRGQVRLGIEAPRECRILRGELIVEVQDENRQAIDSVDATDALGTLFADKTGPVRP